MLDLSVFFRGFPMWHKAFERFGFGGEDARCFYPAIGRQENYIGMILCASASPRENKNKLDQCGGWGDVVYLGQGFFSFEQVDEVLRGHTGLALDRFVGP